MKQVLVDPVNKSFDVTLKELLSLRPGQIIQRCGILQSGDFPQWAVDGLKSMGKEPGLLPKAIHLGIPPKEDVAEALKCIYDAEREKLPVVICGRVAKNPRYFYINSQGNFLANAQKVSNYMKGEPNLCFDSIE